MGMNDLAQFLLDTLHDKDNAADFDRRPVDPAQAPMIMSMTRMVLEKLGPIGQSPPLKTLSS